MLEGFLLFVPLLVLLLSLELLKGILVYDVFLVNLHEFLSNLRRRFVLFLVLSCHVELPLLVVKHFLVLRFYIS